MPSRGYTYLLKPFIIFFAIILAYIILNLTALAQISFPRLKMQDFLWELKHTISPLPKELNKIVLIAIDDTAYSKYGGKWPWEREAFAAIIYNIIKDRPNVIGINLAFLGQTEKEGADDLILKLAFQDAGNVIGASYFEPNGRYIIPNEFFLPALKDYGFTNKPVEIDRVIRFAKFFEPIKNPINKVTGILDFSLEIKLLCASYNISPGDIEYKNNKLIIPGLVEIPVVPDRFTFINYTAKRKDLNIIPVLDVMTNKVPPGTFKDKIVLLGTTGKIFHEENSTPLGLLSGIEIIANSLAMLLSGKFVYIAPYPINLFIITFLLALLTYWFWRSSVIKNIFIFLGSALGAFILSLLLVINNIIVDFFGIYITILISYLAVEGTKYTTLLIEEIKLKNMAILDPTTELSNRRYLMFRLNSDLRRACRERRNLSSVLFSIDNLEQFSSTLGVDKADLVLKRISQLIKKNSRKTRRGDFIARYGESILCVILRDTPSQGAIRYANRIKTTLEQPFTTSNGEKIKPNISAGILSIEKIRTESAITFMDYLENTLQQARHEHNRIYLYDKEVRKTELIKYETIKALDEIDLDYVAEELNEKNKELVEVIRKLRTTYTEMSKTEKLSAMGKLASSIHHELNNPLSALRTCLQTVDKNLGQQLEASSIQKTKALVDSALEEIQRMIELNKGLKELYKPPKMTLEPLNVNKTINEILEFLHGEFTKKRIELIANLGKNIPDIEANKADLKQAFLNIILNAIDAMPDGGKLIVDTILGQDIEIRISDTGCGIPPENLEKIFEALFTTKEEGKGAGLGLYVTKQKIEQHNGTIGVSSQVNQGTTFTIQLPFG